MTYTVQLLCKYLFTIHFIRGDIFNYWRLCSKELAISKLSTNVASNQNVYIKRKNILALTVCQSKQPNYMSSTIFITSSIASHIPSSLPPDLFSLPTLNICILLVLLRLLMASASKQTSVPVCALTFARLYTFVCC